MATAQSVNASLARLSEFAFRFFCIYPELKSTEKVDLLVTYRVPTNIQSIEL